MINSSMKFQLLHIREAQIMRGASVKNIFGGFSYYDSKTMSFSLA